MATAYPYIRFSDTVQALGDSERRQRELAVAFAAHHKLTLGREFQDLGVSAFRGKNTTRGKLFEFLEEVRNGRITRGSWLLIEDFDRLSRGIITKALPVLFELMEAG